MRPFARGRPGIGLALSEAKRRKRLEDWTMGLKRLFADAMRDKAALKEALGKNLWSAPLLQGLCR